MKISFDQWIAELDALALAEGCGPSPTYSEQCGAESFRDAYDFGETPEDAWQAEKEAAADCGCA